MAFQGTVSKCSWAGGPLPLEGLVDMESDLSAIKLSLTTRVGVGWSDRTITITLLLTWFAQQGLQFGFHRELVLAFSAAAAGSGSMSNVLHAHIIINLIMIMISSHYQICYLSSSFSFLTLQYVCNK